MTPYQGKSLPNDSDYHYRMSACHEGFSAVRLRTRRGATTMYVCLIRRDVKAESCRRASIQVRNYRWHEPSRREPSPRQGRLLSPDGPDD